MSRSEARKRITLEDHARAVTGVERSLDADVIDESPAAYKRSRPLSQRRRISLKLSIACDKR